MPLIPIAIPVQQPRMMFFDADGKPLVGGKVYSYKIGTDLFKPTFRNANKTALNQNPVVLDNAGSALIYMTGNHLLKIYDKFNNFVEMRFLPVTQMRAFFFDKFGKPLKFGKVETFDIASTIKKTSYQSSEQAVINPNPIILDADGSAIICIIGSYRLRVYDSKNMFIWDEDFQREPAFALTSKLYPLEHDEVIESSFGALSAVLFNLVISSESIEVIRTSFSMKPYILYDPTTSLKAETESINSTFGVVNAYLITSATPVKQIDDAVNSTFSATSAVRKNLLILNTSEIQNVGTNFSIPSFRLVE
ncbi:hypothetical protein F966_03622 [Acinetobacter higginsii]|uniref:Uncharacterized protein n=1 Tax=Acinetobacter higginsii TaxID=70347 RepID=N8XL10_9GAMM|nr:hypothetical protein [Acinetobacter higginsii]ENV07765.1 hypothetical protein F966_03622 [Acinetobacter higginsii]